MHAYIYAFGLDTHTKRHMQIFPHNRQEAVQALVYCSVMNVFAYTH